MDEGSLSGLKKRSVTLGGHRTSIALEPEFWDALDAAADAEKLSLAGLLARIDEARLDRGRPLASAVRVYLLKRANDA